MDTVKNILFVALLASTFSSSNSLYARFASFDAIEEFMEQQLEESLQSIQHIRTQFKSLSIAPHQTFLLNSNDVAATITVPNVQADNVDARLNNENTQLVITTPNKTITLKIHNNIIGIESKETIEKKAPKSDVQNDIAQFMGTTIAYQESLVAGKSLLEKQTIDYNTDTKDLIITIPLQQASHGKVVTINKLPKKEIPIQPEPTKPTEPTPQEK